MSALKTRTATLPGNSVQERAALDDQATSSLLEALAFRVRFLSAPQVQRGFFYGASETAVRKRLDRMVAAGSLERVSITAHPEIAVPEPLFVWTPDDPAPDFAAIAYRCRQRWDKALVSHTVYRASVVTLAQWGARRPMPLRSTQATHDLHVGAIYVRLLISSPIEAALWRPEDSLTARPGERMPDALIGGADMGQSLRRAIEFGGACKPARVEKLHAFGSRYALPYELW